MKNKFSGPPPINKTIRRYFQSLNWKEFWNRIKNNNPIVFIIIKKHSGMIESVMIKEAKPGEEFMVHGDEFIKDKDKPVAPPPPLLSDEDLMKEMSALMDGENIENIPPTKTLPVKEKKEYKPPVHNDEESIDLQIGDQIIVSHNLEKKKCYVIEIDDEADEVKVEFQDGTIGTKKSDEIISLAV